MRHRASAATLADRKSLCHRSSIAFSSASRDGSRSSSSSPIFRARAASRAALETERVRATAAAHLKLKYTHALTVRSVTAHAVLRNTAGAIL